VENKEQSGIKVVLSCNCSNTVRNTKDFHFKLHLNTKIRPTPPRCVPKQKAYAIIAILKSDWHKYWHKGILAAAIVSVTMACLFVMSVYLPVLTAQEFTNSFIATSTEQANETNEVEPVEKTWPSPLNKEEYNERLLKLAGFSSTTLNEQETVVLGTGTTTKPKYQLVTSDNSNTTVRGKLWPPTNPYPNGGALLPFNRIVAYYGNLYSPYMGILGELEHDELLSHLRQTVADWEAADPDTPVIPAIHYIAMVAQGSAGTDGMYRAVMPQDQVEKAAALAHEVDGVLFLDLQVGLSDLPSELPKFAKYLKEPDVHLGIDPEFSMKGGQPPGTVIGTFDATDINYAIDWLADIVNEYKLPPKVLVVHRFTQDMVTNYQDIKPRPEVQVVMDMDGWGSKHLKTGTYQHVIIPEPVQFAGIKLFYKNDLKPPSTGLFTPEEVLEFTPKPIYIQYQ